MGKVVRLLVLKNCFSVLKVNLLYHKFYKNCMIGIFSTYMKRTTDNVT